MQTARNLLLLGIALSFGALSSLAEGMEFQELPEQSNTFSDRLLNFHLTKPSEQWKFSSVQPSANPLARVIGLEYDTNGGVTSPRIKIYTHEWGSEELSKNCIHVRSLGRKYVDQIVTPINAYVNWTDASSPYYGWREACEEMGEVWDGNKRIASVRFVGMPAGTRQFTFVLISRPETWDADNSALFEVVESFGTIEPWRSVKVVAISLLICFAVLTMRKRRINSTKTIELTPPTTST